MKKIFSLAAMAMAVMFASCSQDDTLAESSKATSPTTVSFSLNLPSDAIGTRADETSETPKRYIMQLFSKVTGTYGDNTTYTYYSKEIINPTETSDYDAMRQLTSTTGTFEVDLSKSNLTVGKEYIAVFWADTDDGTVYNTSSLSEVSVNRDNSYELYDQVMAFCGSEKLIYGEMKSEYSVALKRAVAQVNLIQNNAVTKENEEGAGNFVIFFNGSSSFNAVDGELVNDGSISKKVPFAGGSVSATQNIGSFLTFAPVNEAATTDFNITYNVTNGSSSNLGGPTNVPLQANYKTNIKGDFVYSTRAKFSVSTDSN